MDNSMCSQTSEAATLPDENRFVDSAHASNFLCEFSKLYHNQEFVDVVLCIEDKEFPCHRNVLAIASPFFMAMFSNDMAESRQERVTLKDIDALTMELVLEYIYSGQARLSEETVQHLLSAANLFQLIALRNGCAGFMMNHITVTNCIGIFFFARAHECTELAAKAKEIINNQFPVLCKQQEFLLLPADKLIEIISDDAINVTLEEMVYEACMEWVKKDLDTRCDHLPMVMRCVRFANINSYYFCDKIDTNELLRSYDDLKKTLDTVRYYHMMKNRQCEMDLNLMPRQGMPYKRVVMILANPYTEDNLKKFNSMELLLPRSGKVEQVCKLPSSLYTPGCAITGDNQIYLAGGALKKINYRGSITSEGVNKTLFLFDPTECAWQPKNKMFYARAQFALVVVDSYLFAIGGQDGGSILNSVERYEPNTNIWTMVASLPIPLRFITATSYRGKLFVFGGEHTTDVSHAAFRYDPSEDVWTELPPMKCQRLLAGCVVYREKIFVIGGNCALSDKWRKEFLPEHCISSVEIYDPASNSWSDGPELHNALCGAGVVKYGNTILIVGGEDDKSWMAGLGWLKETDDGTLGWIEGQELPTVMSSFGCVVANVPQEILEQQG